mmetsp:Transcript_36307/g.65376  ORF Transcript_36307/g.65376 Transcript_36307/m.65376 type:complete len:606 (-) Transcript_36307:298-2115(-)
MANMSDSMPPAKGRMLWLQRGNFFNSKRARGMLVFLGVASMFANLRGVLKPWQRIRSDTAVICTIVSNEEFYLDEWLDYNMGIGFSHIFLFDNSDDFDLGHGWIERRPRLNRTVTIYHYPGQGKQWTAYQDCAREVYNSGHRWIFFTDADEFLVLKKHSNVVSFLLEHDRNHGALSINWQVHSWNEQLQYSPQPVTKRFQGSAGWIESNIHVKTISNVDAIDLTGKHHPHYAALKDGFRQIDTSGNLTISSGEKAFNKRHPSDVALVYHHSTKSWKEYINKRMRGRATMTGKGLKESVAELIDHARKGNGLHSPSTIDSSAWDTLKSVSNKYKFFDSFKSDLRNSNQVLANESSAICCVVSDQEAYIDEWADYHLALGFSAIYIFDTSEEYWFSQWGEKRNQTGSISVTHFPGNIVTHPSHKAKAYAKCLSLHGEKHSSLSLIDVNDFFMFPERTGLDPLVELSSQGACAYQFERIVFGHGGQYVYDPLPVTKRFVFRVDGSPDFASPSLLFLTNSTERDDVTETLEYDLLQYLHSGKFQSEICDTHPTRPKKVVVYHYTRSVKECNKERGDSKICNLEGSVEDDSAWEQMQYFLPEYSNFNGMI